MPPPRSLFVALMVLSSAVFAAAPTALTDAATSVNPTTAQLNGRGNPGGESTLGWFRYATTNPGTCDDVFGTRVPSAGGTSLGSGAALTAYSVSTSGLLPGTTYYVCAITNNGSGTAVGTVVQFSTPAQAPAVTTLAATVVTSFGATLNGSAIPSGASSTGYFRYSTVNPGSCNNSFGTVVPMTPTSLGSGNASVSYSEPLSGLQAGVTYYYCAIAQNGVGTGLGTLLQFTTLVAVPTVVTNAPSPIAGTSATLRGTVNPNGASTSGWFRIASSDPGSCNDAFGTRAPSSGGNALGGGSSNVSHSWTATLSPGTTYYSCAIAQNSEGITLGNVVSFTTPDIPTVTTNAQTNLQPTSLTLNGSAITNLAAATAWFRISPTNPGVCNDGFGTRWPAVSGGTALNAGTPPQAFSQNVSGLLPGTTYFACAIVQNSVGTGYGALITINTPPAVPIVSTNAVSANTTGSSVTFNGTADPRGDATSGYFRYATTNPTTCNDTFGTRAPAAGGSSLGGGNGSVGFTQAVTGLTPGTTYYVCAIATNSVGTATGGVVTFTTPAVPTVTTQAPSNFSTGTQATWNASVVPNGAATTGYFRYATVNPGTCDDTFGTRLPAVGGNTLGAGTLAQSSPWTATSLTPGTTYYFCAIATNSVGMGFGAVLSFTLPAVPTMVTDAPTLLTATSATLNGSGDPNAATTTAWFRYATTNPVFCDDFFGTRAPTSGGTNLLGGTTAVNYSQAIAGLLPGTTYYACAIGNNSVGTGFGAPLAFTTPPTAPLLSTNTTTLVTGNSATFNGTVNARGANTTAWFRYATVNPTTCNDTFGTRAPASGGTAVPAGNTNVAVNEPVNTLTPGTTYFVCVLAQNSEGLSVGNVTSFTTPAIPDVTTELVTALNGTSVTLQGTGDPNLGTATGFFRYATSNPGTCNDTFGTRAPAAANSGTNLGAGNSPVGFAQSVTGLTPGTVYYYCAIASNLVGTGFGSILSFTTPAVPTVATVAPTAVTATSAALNGSATPNGATSIGWFRYATVDPVTCNDTFGTRAPAISGGSSLGAGNSPIAFTQTVSSLLPGTTYFVCALASNSVGTGLGTPITVTTPPLPPLVTTNSASSVTATTATLNGTVTARGAATTAWFRYATVNPGSCNDTFGFRAPFTGGTAAGSGNSSLAVSEAVTGLALATQYFYCVVAQNSEGTSFGAINSFTTAPLAPSVTTLAATNTSTVAATLNASVTPNGSATTAWVRYSTTNPGTCSDTFGTRAPISGGTTLGGGTAAVPFSITPTTLTPGATYYYCAIAQNGVGMGYGAVLNFTTDSTPPTVNTLAATAIGGTTATLNASITANGSATTSWFRYATSNPGACNDAFGTRVPVAGNAIGSGTTAVAHAEPLTGLTPGQTYYFCAIAQNALGTTFGLVLNFSTPQAPTVTSNAASPVTSTSATLNASGVANGTAAQGWFRYDTTNPTVCDDTFGTRVPATGGSSLGSGSTIVNFAQPLSGLLPGTAYFFCAIAQNGVGTSFGAVLSFTTPPAVPSVAVLAASAVTSTAATLNANVNPNGAVTDVYYRYSTTNPGTCNDAFGTRAPASGGTSLPAPSVLTPVPQAITGLSPGTTYYFCPLATNTVGMAVGGVQSFTTLAAPTVTTSAATLVASTTATLNGAANPNRDATTGWFRYSTTNPTTCDDTFGTRFPATGGTSLGSGTSAAPFSQPVTGLTQGTVYYYCAIASNSVATSFGAVQTFTTTTAPSPVTLAATSVTVSSATLQGSTNPNGMTTTAWFRYSAINPGTCSDAFGTRAPTSGGAALGSGSASVAHSQAISGLVAGTTYYYCAIGLNSAGTGLGNVMTFTTPGAPSVTTLAASAVGTTTATLEGAANPNLGTATGWFRYNTTSPGTCNDTFGTRTPTSGGTSLGNGSTPVPYSQSITGLAQGTTYWVCAIASNAQGTRFGTPVSFTTAAGPSVSSSAATNVGNTSAQLNGNVNPRSSPTTGWFRYSTTTGTCSDTFGTRFPATGGVDLGSGSSTVPLNLVLTGLTANTRYYFCAVGQNANGVDFGGMLNFTTTDVPVATTTAATSVTGSTAALNGSGTPNGLAATGWFRYSTTNPGTCDDAFGTRAPTTGGTALGAGIAAVNFSSTISGLASTTTYFFCAIVQNSLGTSFGPVLSFTTPAAPIVTTNAASSVTASTATLNGQANPNGATATGWFRYSTTNPTTCNDTFGTRAPTSGGTALGTGSSAVSYTAGVSSLVSGTTYYFCAIASNVSGTSFGAVQSFTTPGAPVVTSAAADSLTASSARLNGSVNPAGNLTTAYFRYSTSHPGSCSDTFGARAPTTGGTSVAASFTSTDYNQSITGLLPATTYYFCAIASNASGTRFGSVLSFATPAGPSVTTTAATLVTGTSATLNGSANPRGATATGWFRYATTSPPSCNDTFGTRVPATGGTDLGAGSTAVAYTEALTGLAQGTTYYYCALAQNAAGLGSGGVQTFTTPGAPTVTTSAASAVGSTGVTFNGAATPNLATATGWFRYSTTNPGTCDDTFGTRAPTTGGTSLGAGTTSVPFSQSVTGLTAGTTYYFCALASNASGTRFGTVQSVLTLSPPTVVTVAASGASGTQATLNGTANPNASATTAWFRYAAVNPTTCNDTFGTRTPTTGGTSLGSGTSAAPFTAALTGLTPGGTYWFCAIAQNALGLSFGTPLSFTLPAATPVVTTGAPSLVTGSTASFNGTANPGGATATGWFRYATTNPGTCNDTFGTRAPATGGTTLGAGTSSTPFSQAVTGLQPSTTYYVCAIAQNAQGTGFGAVQTFGTAGRPVVLTAPASGTTGTSATLNGQVTPNGLPTTGWFRYATTSPGTCDDTFGTRAPATGGTSLGAGTVPTSLAQFASGLVPGTTYFYCALASNAVGTAVGNVQSFRTAAAPTIVTSSASNLSGRDATLNGQGTPNGAATTGWFRYATVDPGTCNDTFGTRAPLAGGTNLGAGTSSQGFSQALTQLQPGATYFFCALGQNTVGTSFGLVQQFNVEAPTPTVATVGSSDVAGQSATLSGRANPRGTTATGWFRYDTTEPSACNDTFGTRVPAMGGMDLGAGFVDAPYELDVTGLKPGTTYFFCAVASNLGGASFGAVQRFTTGTTTPTIVTGPATPSASGATLTATANTNGMTGKVWFQVSNDPFYACLPASGQRAPFEGLPQTDADGDRPVTFEWTGAKGSWSYCAVIETAGGVSYGQVQKFTVGEAPAAGCSCATGGELALVAAGLVLLRRRRRGSSR